MYLLKPLIKVSLKPISFFLHIFFFSEIYLCPSKNACPYIRTFFLKNLESVYYIILSLSFSTYIYIIYIYIYYVYTSSFPQVLSFLVYLLYRTVGFLDTDSFGFKNASKAMHECSTASVTYIWPPAASNSMRLKWIWITLAE